MVSAPAPVTVAHAMRRGARFPRTHVLLAFCLAFSRTQAPFWRSGVLDLAFCPLAFCPGVLGGAGVLGLAFWSPGVLGLAFWAAWRSGSGVLACLAFCLAFCPGVLGPGVLLAFWRSAGVLPGVLAFCWRPGVLLAFWRSAWRSAQLRVALPPCCSLHQSEGVQFFSSRFGFV